MTEAEQRAVAERQRIEEELMAVVAPLVRRFAVQMRREGVQASKGEVMVAVGFPRIPKPSNPFTLGKVNAGWKAAVDAAVGAVEVVIAPVTGSAAATAAYLEGVRTRMMLAGYPVNVHEAITNVLANAQAGGWSAAGVEKALSEALGLAKVAPEATAQASATAWETAARDLSRTEATRAFNYAEQGAMAQRGFPRKQWVAVMDARTRPTHATAHGQEVAVNEPFIVGGWAMMYPGDDAAPPEETANCRCVLVESGEPEDMNAILGEDDGGAGEE